jgi:hypothetical protein
MIGPYDSVLGAIFVTFKEIARASHFERDAMFYSLLSLSSANRCERATTSLVSENMSLKGTGRILIRTRICEAADASLLSWRRCRLVNLAQA